ncbi:hypothetical protein [Ralstonia sp. SET104]|uniref:hypothetical protein n=1 Tax=Ralstonia sp. SET104 TaxID=2448774 RepID=UPI000F5758CA|nr:hypothetical protein [Ralstonia sp. SET104]GCB06328.1 hypothetical protein PSUB009319_39590 [Ralstonia sp. SET104]
MTRLPADSSDFPACETSHAYQQGAHAARAFIRIVYTCLQAGRTNKTPDDPPARKQKHQDQQR